MRSNVLEVRGLRKSYGQLEAVKGIDFDVRAGEVFALIGPNGAGKTTTLRIVATILRPTQGDVIVDGTDVTEGADHVREIISYLPEEAGAYKNMTGDAYLKFVANIFFAEAADRADALAQARELTGLGDRLGDKLGSFSKGMTRKLLLARTLMTRPKLAILDEPTSGLDVLNALEVRDTVKRFAASGMGVLLSSHNMLEIEYLSDRVALLYKGEIKDTGTLAELKEKFGAANLEEVFAEVAR
ncbi:MAG: ABC transporter ATP-binding protein [Actinomycetota bacterium]|jgi:ABC-2 type transport system ATP-binding protein|nr:ABC transporter ATP-binding protein [Actinomycetota bacterium]